jgi:sporulation protein YlmC with PRC-barrel domain
MRVSRMSAVMLAGAMAAFVWAGMALAAVPQNTQNQAGQGGFNAIASNQIIGQRVDDQQGEKLGTVEYLIIDHNNGKVDYAGLSVSGVSNYVAVPFQALKIMPEQNNKVKITLDVTKDHLKQAPTFEKDKWQEFDNGQWRSQVDSFYRQASAERPTTR